MIISSSLAWDNISGHLVTELKAIDYNPDLWKMFKNIDQMVGDLSRLEVDARRTRVQHYTKEQLDKINGAIDHLEKLLLIAKLMA